MKVEATINKINTNGVVKAYGDVVLDGAFVIHGVKVLEKENKTYVAFPSRKDEKNNKWCDIAHPCTQQMREEIEQKMLEAYNASLNTNE
jgi:stage V sporulation protein G